MVINIIIDIWVENCFPLRFEGGERVLMLIIMKKMRFEVGDINLLNGVSPFIEMNNFFSFSLLLVHFKFFLYFSKNDYIFMATSIVFSFVDELWPHLVDFFNISKLGLKKKTHTHKLEFASLQKSSRVK